MSILNRLVARANGTAGSSLRTRLPSRFEAGQGMAQEGFVTVQEDVPVRQEPAPHSPPVTEATQHRTPEAPRSEAPPQKHKAHRPEPPEPLQPPLPREETEKAAVPARANLNMPASQSPETSQTPPPLLPAAPAPEVHITRLEQLAPEPDAQQATPFETPAPVPLLPPDKAANVEHIPQAVAATAPRQQSQAPLPTAEQAPPEITIHIGRIDLRSDTPKPAQRRTSARKPALPSLSDYLKGGVS